MLRRPLSEFFPSGVTEILGTHEAISEKPHVQRLLSDERHRASLTKLQAHSSARTQNLLLACTMPHASDWLLTAPIPGLGLSMHSDNFRTALKFRLGMPLFDPDLKCPASSAKTGEVCGEELDAHGDHALCCHYGTSRVFRHNQVRDILVTQPKLQGFRRW